MTKHSPWLDYWIIQNKLSGGGQGTTFVVTRRDNSDSTLFVLKLLNQQRNSERRRRMYREVSALRTFDNRGIPRYVESNVEQYDDQSVKLYIVVEYIPGPTLRAVEKPLTLETAISVVSLLLNIVEYCHTENVIHRDIKPDNIILRKGIISDPVLIDFGLSFNETEASAQHITESQQQLGNKFLRLPELVVSDSIKRDYRSDITCCCGILFYLLTQIEPVALLNERGQKPHQTENAKAALAQIRPEQLSLLRHVFDVGFEILIDRRWQSVEALRGQLQRVIEAPAIQRGESNLEAKIESLKAGLQSEVDYQYRFEVSNLLKQVSDHVASVHAEVLVTLQSEFDSVSGGFNIDLTNYYLKRRLGFVHKLYPDKAFKPLFWAFITGSELVVISEESGDRTELLREALNGISSWNTFRDRVKRYFVDGLYAKLDG